MRLLGFTSQPTKAPTDVGTPLVELKGVTVSYPLGTKRDDFQSLAFRSLLRREKRQSSFQALQGVDFIGRSGDIVGIIGSNGAGKTTLCKVISGVLNPDSGKATVRGDVYALLSLGTGFHSNLSGRENIFLNGMMLGMSRQELEQVLPQIEEFAGLGQFIDQPLKTYSNGMRARLGFSVAIMVRPEILILDETLSVGDAEFGQRAAAKMQELVQNASLVIVVTHQTEFVEKYCTTAMWLEQGRVRSSGDPSEVVAAYKASLHKTPAPPVARVVKLPEAKPPETTSVVTPPETKPQVTARAIVTARNISLAFPMMNRSGKYQALKDVSFVVNQGDILGIIGRNGAGKTTLCRVLTGILKPDSGQLSVGGETAALLTLGTGFNHQLTGRDNILLNGMMLGIPKKTLQSLSDEIIAFAELGDWIDRPMKEYSRGMISRLGFSIAATIQPDIFIVDEALSVGDLAFNRKASAKMQQLMSRAKAVIVVTHDMSFVQQVCSRAIWLDGGALKFDGSAKDAVSSYLQATRA